MYLINNINVFFSLVAGKEAFQEHTSIHFKHACPMCEYKSRTEGRLKKHIENFHNNPTPEQLAANKQKKGKMPAKPKKFTCKTCGHETPTKVSYNSYYF